MSTRRAPFAVASWQRPTHGAQSPELVGGKAAGLLRLPLSWVPPFIVLGPSFLNRRASCGSVKSALASHRIANTSPRLAFEGVLGGEAGVVLLRSNSPCEQARPGRGRTTVVRGVAGDIVQALEASLGDPAGGSQLPLIQRAIEPALLGHMSNDLSVSRNRTDWLIEGELSLRGPELRVIRGRCPSRAAPLRAEGADDLVRSLRAVGGWLARRGRFRVEWVWDGARVWVVQADRAEIGFVPSPARRRTSPIRLDGRLEGDEGFRGCKVRVWKAFRNLDLPTYPLLVMTGSNQADRPRLEAFFDDNEKTELVVRTDALYKDGSERVLLPTSPPCRSAAEAATFIRRAGQRFHRHGLSPERFAFLVSPLLQGEASALVHADPRSARVRIDALWGYPDGVMNLPHDSYEVRGQSVSRTIRFKPARLEATSAGWSVQGNGEDTVRAPTLSNGEVLTLARWAKELARRQGQPTVLMAFARLAGRRGERGCVPFWFGPGRRDLSDTQRSNAMQGELPEIHTAGDLKRLAKRALRTRGFVLSPDAKHMRDPAFLCAAGELAARQEVPVYFSGSVLGHPYYLLRSTGAEVVRVEEPGGATPRASDAFLGGAAVVQRPFGLERVSYVPLESLLDSMAEEQRSAVEGRAAEELLSTVLARHAAELSAAAGSPTRRAASWFAQLPRVCSPMGTEALIATGPGAIPLFMDESPSEPSSS